VVAAVAVVLIALRVGNPGITAGCSTGTGSQRYTLSPAQAQNASIIAAVAARKGLPDHAVTVALAAALQESRLTDLASGDRDSVGLFQQRPSQGWGTPAQLQDPNYASTAFYNRLEQLPGWQSMAVTEAAQAIQHSAAPDAYARWEPEARTLAIALSGEVAAGLTCRLTGFTGAAPPPGELVAAAASEFGAPSLGVTVDQKRGWAVATWAVAHAEAYHLRAVAFQGWTWTASSGVWARGPIFESVVTVAT